MEDKLKFAIEYCLFSIGGFQLIYLDSIFAPLALFLCEIRLHYGLVSQQAKLITKPAS